MRGLKNKSWRRLAPFGATLIMAVTMFGASSRAMNREGALGQPSSSSTSTGLRILGLGTAALLRYATQVIWPTQPALPDEETAARENFRQRRIAQLEDLCANPRVDLNDFVALANIARLDEARLVILDEDPLDVADITRIMLFLRDFAQADDAIVVESEGAHTLTLENLYLMRRMVLERTEEAPEHIDRLLSRAQRREQRRQLVEQFTPLLLGIQAEMQQHNVVARGVQLYTFAPFGNLGITQGENGIRAQVAAQVMTVEEALQRHRRVFLIRNRAFSPHFFARYLRDCPNIQWTLEERYQCTLESLDDIINCEAFWLFQLLGSLHRSLCRVTTVELLPKYSTQNQ